MTWMNSGRRNFYEAKGVLIGLSTVRSISKGSYTTSNHSVLAAIIFRFDEAHTLTIDFGSAAERDQVFSDITSYCRGGGEMTANTQEGLRAKRTEANKWLKRIKACERTVFGYPPRRPITEKTHNAAFNQLVLALAEGLSLLLEHHLPEKERDWDAIASQQRAITDASTDANANAGD